jgi:hypothetical protein
MDTKKTTAKIRNTALSVTIISFLLVVAFIISPNFFKSRMEDEVYKLTYQFLLLTVIGSAITFLFTFYVKLREEAAKQKELEETRTKEKKSLQRKFYNEFIQAYNDGKKIRRFLRARVRKISTANPNQETILLKTDRYDELMKELTVLQLKCEFFCDEVSSNPDLFASGDVKRLSENLTKIQEYLNQIVDEYENCYRSFPGQSFIDQVDYIPLDNLDRLKEFISKYKEATCFKHQFKKAAGEVSEILLKVLTS